MNSDTQEPGGLPPSSRRTSRLLDGLRELLWDARLLRSPLARPAMPLWELAFRLFALPGIRQRHPWFSAAKNHFSWLPVNQEIRTDADIPLPEAVLFRLIDRATHLVALDLCGCRTVRGCREFPQDIGCLMMGEDALRFPAKIRRSLDRHEARRHVRHALEAGLVPVAGKARMDNEIFLLPDRGRLLTVCFCCPCCCASRFFRHLPVDILDRVCRPVPGLRIETTEACTGCGACVDHCYVGALSVIRGRVVRSDRCRLCGRCASFCPEGAVQLRLEDPHGPEKVVHSIESYVRY